jgi:hypothetical protein
LTKVLFITQARVAGGPFNQSPKLVGLFHGQTTGLTAAPQERELQSFPSCITVFVSKLQDVLDTSLRRKLQE